MCTTGPALGSDERLQRSRYEHNQPSLGRPQQAGGHRLCRGMEVRRAHIWKNT